MKHIGIFIELDNGLAKETNWGPVTLARQQSESVFALITQPVTSEIKSQCETYGISRIIEIELATESLYNPDILARSTIGAMEENDINILFGLTTAAGKDFLPRVAALLDAPLIMDCIEVDINRHLAKTSQYSGKTIATIKVEGDYSVFGIRPNAIEHGINPSLVEVSKFDARHIKNSGFKVLKTGTGLQESSISLTEADVIIAGGRGMKNQENFTLLERCAKPLNAAVAASRVAVDSGWVPYRMQVGQTGEKVCPKVYIACGISGSVQHFAGMKTSKMIIAINSDENAAIMANCDFRVRADVLTLLPELARVLEND